MNIFRYKIRITKRPEGNFLFKITKYRFWFIRVFSFFTVLDSVKTANRLSHIMNMAEEERAKMKVVMTVLDRTQLNAEGWKRKSDQRQSLKPLSASRSISQTVPESSGLLIPDDKP